LRVLLKMELTALPWHSGERLGDGSADTGVAVTHNKGGPIHSSCHQALEEVRPMFFRLGEGN
ncbi:MAG: hypothetical protein MSQ05_09535, partial [Akkermansia sp.]|nr:hypothetical protein [Akkermansia sp.]